MCRVQTKRFLMPLYFTQGLALFWAGVAAIALPCAAADFAISQIANENLINRDAVISESGLVAWADVMQGTTGDAYSDIYAYFDGRLFCVTQTKRSRNMSNIRPQVQGDTIVWVGTFTDSEPTDWVLQTVSEGDKGEHPELNAVYIPREAGGKQWFEGPIMNDAMWAARQSNYLARTGTATNKPAGANPAMPVVAVTNKPPAKPIIPFAIDPPAAKEQSVAEGKWRTRGSGATEICLWKKGDPSISRLTRNNRDDLGPSVWGDLVAWQTGRGWPFGWEIMIWCDGYRAQLTTNYYYDMAPKVQGRQVAWYGWDGHDFEIYMYDQDKKVASQITSNNYDDVSPEIWGGQITWEGFPGADADIFLWKDGKIKKISDNIEDDLNPRIWNGKVVWQGFDGDDFEIYYYDGEKTTKLTSNTYDDLNPDIRDGLVCWMGYEGNWDSEVFVWDGSNIKRLTDNEYDDRDPRTAGGRVVWQAQDEKKSFIFLAEPKK